MVLPASGGSSKFPLSLCGMVSDDSVGICCQLDDDAGVLCIPSLVLIGTAFIMNMCVGWAMDSSRNSSRGPGSLEVAVNQCCCDCGVGWVDDEPE